MRQNFLFQAMYSILFPSKCILLYPNISDVRKLKIKKMSCSYLKLGIKLWENSPKTNCWYEKTFYLRQFEFAPLLVDLLSRNVICGRSNHVTAHWHAGVWNHLSVFTSLNQQREAKLHSEKYKLAWRFSSGIILLKGYIYASNMI